MKKSDIIRLLFVIILSVTIYTNLKAQQSFNISTITNPSPGYLFVDSDDPHSISYFDNTGHSVYTKSMYESNSGFSNIQIQGNRMTCYNTLGASWLIMDNNFNIVDSIAAPSSLRTDFHEFILTPAGHYILMGTGPIIVDMSHYVTDGKKDARIVDYKIFEYDQNKTLLHTWSAYEHYNFLDATDDVDLTNQIISPFHINSMFLDVDGNLIISARHQDEISKINLSTGQFIWRIGGTKCVNNQFTFTNDTLDNFVGFSHQHNVTRLANGNLLMFDNGNMKSTTYSRAVEYQINETSKTATKVWSYSNTPATYSYQMGSVQRMSNGNTLIGWGGIGGGDHDVVATEVDESGNKVFEMTSNTFASYRVHKTVFNMDAVTLNLSSNGLLDFNNSSNTTDVKINVLSLNGSGSIWVQKHKNEASNISYRTIPACINIPNRWVVYYKGVTNLAGKISISLKSFTNLQQKELLSLYYRSNEGSGLFDEIANSSYDKVNDIISGDFAGTGEYIISYKQYLTPETQSPVSDSYNMPTNPLLKWNNISQDDFYSLQIATDINFNSVVFDSTSIRKNEVQLNDILSNYIKYYWRVKTLHIGCESNWSDVASFTTMVGAPMQVYPPDKSTDILTSGKFIWSLVTGGENYQIQVSETEDFMIKIIDKQVTGVVELDYSNLKTGVTYYWRIRASNNGVFGNWSKSNYFKTGLGKVVLSNPANTIGGIPVAGILSWNKVMDATIYRVQLSKDTTFYAPIIDISGLDSTSIKYEALENYTNYYWRVKAGNNDVKGEWSAVWNFKTQVATPVLSAPGNNVLNVSPKATLSWNPVPNAQIYDIILSDKSDYSNPIISTTTSKNSIKTPDLSYAKNYYWKVRAKDSKYFGQWSENRIFTTQPENILVAPNLVYPPDKSYKIALNSVLSWDEVFNATNYELQISMVSDFSDTLISANLDGINEYITMTLEYNTTYFWRIRSSNSKSTSNWSAVRSFTTLMSTPEIISPANGAKDLPPSLKLIWKNSEFSDFYMLQLSKDSIFEQIIEDKDNLVASLFTLDNLSSDTEYYWRVKAATSNNESDWSQVHSFKIKVFTDILTTDETDDILIYPNPASDYIFINSKLPVEGFALFDLSGNNVEKSCSANSINLNGLSSGLYSYILKTGNKVVTGKISVKK